MLSLHKHAIFITITSSTIMSSHHPRQLVLTTIDICPGKEGYWRRASVLAYEPRTGRHTILYDNGCLESVALLRDEHGRQWRSCKGYTINDDKKRAYSKSYLRSEEKPLLLKGVPIVPEKLWKSVREYGGIEVVRQGRLWQQVREELGLEAATSSGSQLNRAFDLYFSLPINKCSGTLRKARGRGATFNSTPPTSPTITSSRCEPTMSPKMGKIDIKNEDCPKFQKRILTLCGDQIAPSDLLSVVNQQGGVKNVRACRLWQKIRGILKLANTTSSGAQLNKAYAHYFENFSASQKRKSASFDEEDMRSRMTKVLKKTRLTYAEAKENDPDSEYFENLDTIAKCIRDWVADCDKDNDDDEGTRGIEEALKEAVHTCDMEELACLQSVLEEEYERIAKPDKATYSPSHHPAYAGLHYTYPVC